ASFFALALSRPPSFMSEGLPHPEHETMMQGASGRERHGSVLILGWAVGCAQILLTSTLLALGARRGPGSAGQGPGLRGLGWLLSAATVIFLLVWSYSMLAYRRYLVNPDPFLVLGLPEPTAAMLYLLWPIPPLLLAGFFVAGFRRFIFSPSDQDAFAELVARRRARSGEPREAPPLEEPA
ncbi:MAG: hypothetical protein AAF725_27025, partial [Acidobacteriota bacterium]